MGSASSTSRPPSVMSGTSNIPAPAPAPNKAPAPASSTSAVSAFSGKPDKDDVNTAAQTKRQNSQAKDVMISYSHADDTAMLRLRAALEKSGLSVWVDITGLKAGVDFLSKIGQAIIDAKCFISLLSDNTIKSKYCQDELALAYVSSKAIFPCGLEKPDQLFPNMDTGMKLQLARFQWTMLNDDETYDDNIQSLVIAITSAIQEQENPKEKPEKKEKPKLERQKSSLQRFNKKAQRKSTFTTKMEEANENLSDGRMMSFWDRNFQNNTVIAWDDFCAAFDKDYKEPLRMIYSKTDLVWLRGILARELNVEENANHVHYEDYMAFCTVEDEFQPFWLRVQDQAVESYTMKEVFDMESSVRVEAIENLGKFHSDAVIGALMDLLTDPDNNVRAVAAISLARTGANTPEVVKKLMKALNDKDRLVRESGCLALGHLKAEAAVQKIVHLWRNDFISHVREAAQVALEQIGGEEANKAMHMTKVLSDEIRMLTNE